MKSELKYNRSIKIAAVGPSVWAKLGPEVWFDDYVIAVADSREYKAPFVVDLKIEVRKLGELTTQKIIGTENFLDIAVGRLSDYKFIVYRPIDPPEGIGPERFISNDLSFSRFEDKKVFRDTFQGRIPIPRYIIMELEDVLSSDCEILYSRVAREIGSKFVLQDNQSGGGRGTYVISSADDIVGSLKTLAVERKGTHIVFSEFIQAYERSIQVFVSDDHIVVGPLQQQLVKNPDLLNPEGRGGVYFCGGQLIFGEKDFITHQIREIVKIVSHELKSAGYKGVFGIDFMVDSQDKVYVIEVNARTTGMLPLLNEQIVDIPIYLLHILELSRENYDLKLDSEEGTIAPYQTANGPKSFITIFNTFDKEAYLEEEISTGNYIFKDGMLKKIDGSARWNKTASCMIQLFCTKSYLARPNLKLCNVFLKEDSFDDGGTLSSEAKEIVAYIKGKVAFKA